MSMQRNPLSWSAQYTRNWRSKRKRASRRKHCFNHRRRRASKWDERLWKWRRYGGFCQILLKFRDGIRELARHCYFYSNRLVCWTSNHFIFKSSSNLVYNLNEIWAKPFKCSSKKHMEIIVNLWKLQLIVTLWILLIKWNKEEKKFEY